MKSRARWLTALCALWLLALAAYPVFITRLTAGILILIVVYYGSLAIMETLNQRKDDDNAST